MADPELISDNERYRKVAKQQSELGDVVAKYREWKKVNADLEGARQMLPEADPELQQMAAADIEQLEPELEKIENDLKILLLPQGSERREERRTGNPQGHRRRRGIAYLRASFSACTSAMRKPGAGRWKSHLCRSRKLAD